MISELMNLFIEIKIAARTRIGGENSETSQHEHQWSNDYCASMHNWNASEKKPSSLNRQQLFDFQYIAKRKASNTLPSYTEYKKVMSLKTRVASVNDYPAGNLVGYDGIYTLGRDSLLANLPAFFVCYKPRS